MVFSSTVFLFLFLPLVLAVYYNPFFKSRSFRNVFLFIASLGFYAWGEPLFVFIFMLSIIVTWYMGLRIQRTGKRIYLIIAIIYHVSILFVFKYLTILAQQLGLLFDKDMSIISITLPIGISFFTFQLMSYLFDVNRGEAQAQKNPLYTGLYVAMFPQLIAGPIVRYEHIAAEISDRRDNFDGVVEGMRRFIYGLGKKVLLANFVAQIADNMFSYIDNASVMTAWLGAIAYSLQIYFDFSGYSDMAIGLGRMFGFNFRENFNYPYISKSVAEFWRRWHISLSTWFRDYVYIPMGGSRVKKSRWVLNLLTVWLLTGIWHGANWTFVLWGLFYFLFLFIEKTVGLSKRLGVFSRVYAMLVVVLAWVLFRSDSVSDAFAYMGNMFGAGTGGFYDFVFLDCVRNTGVVLLAALIGVTPLLRTVFGKLEQKGLKWIEQIWLLAVFAISVMQVVSSTYNPFIYFNF